MKISIFGLGYVGAVSAACLADAGHVVIGVDPVRTKVDMINLGQSPIVEKDLPEMISESVHSGRLRATNDVAAAVNDTELSLVCVGTPSMLNGNLDLRYVRRVCEDIAGALRSKAEYHTVVIRSTVLPGAMRGVVIPALEEISGKRAGVDFGVCNNPEFLREGTAINDFHHPPKTVIGEIDRTAGDIVASLYERIDAPLIRTDMETAEMVKYVDNAWHALKVGFANEIGNICKRLSIDGRKVMEIFCRDTKLNLSSYYLKPGFAFGGSCLPKDLRALTYKARSLDLSLPILNAVLPSNELQVQHALEMVIEKGNRRVGILGFSFKAGTDDLRESPMVELIERLLGKGYDIRIYDRYVNLARLMGANRDYILNHIPHISKLMASSIEEVVSHGQTLVVGTSDPEFAPVIGKLGDGSSAGAENAKVIVDLVRIADSLEEGRLYDGICW